MSGNSAYGERLLPALLVASAVALLAAGRVDRPRCRRARRPCCGRTSATDPSAAIPDGRRCRTCRHTRARRPGDTAARAAREPDTATHGAAHGAARAHAPSRLPSSRPSPRRAASRRHARFTPRAASEGHPWANANARPHTEHGGHARTRTRREAAAATRDAGADRLAHIPTNTCTRANACPDRALSCNAGTHADCRACRCHTHRHRVTQIALPIISRDRRVKTGARQVPTM